VTLPYCLIKSKNLVLLRAQGQYTIAKRGENGRYHCQLGGVGSLNSGEAQISLRTSHLKPTLHLQLTSPFHLYPSESVYVMLQWFTKLCESKNNRNQESYTEPSFPRCGPHRLQRIILVIRLGAYNLRWPGFIDSGSTNVHSDWLALRLSYRQLPIESESRQKRTVLAIILPSHGEAHPYNNHAEHNANDWGHRLWLW